MKKEIIWIDQKKKILLENTFNWNWKGNDM